MAWLAKNKTGTECIFEYKPIKGTTLWKLSNRLTNWVKLPKGSIKKLIGREMTWEDEPYKI